MVNSVSPALLDAALAFFSAKYVINNHCLVKEPSVVTKESDHLREAMPMVDDVI